MVAQPGGGVRVQVVGGLVEQQGLRTGEQDPGQFHAAPLPARQGLQRLGQHPAGQPQAGGDRRGLGLGRVAAEAVQPFLGVAVAAHGRVPAGRIRVGHLLLGVAHRGPDLVETAGRQHPVHGQAGQVTGPRVLRKVADRAGPAHRAARGQPLPGEHPRQRGLARPVPADQADLVARGDSGNSPASSSNCAPARSSRPLATITRTYSPHVSVNWSRAAPQSPGRGVYGSRRWRERRHPARVPERRSARAKP